MLTISEEQWYVITSFPYHSKLFKSIWGGGRWQLPPQPLSDTLMSATDYEKCHPITIIQLLATKNHCNISYKFKWV